MFAISDYKSRLYEEYHSTHVADRKGVDDVSTLAARGRIWDETLGHLLPEDRDARILDGACGNGGLVGWLGERGYRRVEGVDISPEVISVGHGLGIDSIRVGDFVETLRREPGEFDVVVLRDVLEHFDKSQVLEVLDTVRNGLRPGGLLLVHVPNADSPMFGRVRYGDFTHETAFTSSSLNQVLLSCRFHQVGFHPSGPVATSVKSGLRVAAWAFVSRMYKVLVFVETGTWPKVVTQNIIAVARCR